MPRLHAKYNKYVPTKTDQTAWGHQLRSGKFLTPTFSNSPAFWWLPMAGHGKLITWFKVDVPDRGSYFCQAACEQHADCDAAEFDYCTHVCNLKNVTMMVVGSDVTHGKCSTLWARPNV